MTDCKLSQFLAITICFLTSAGIIYGQSLEIRNSKPEIRTIFDTPVEFTGDRSNLFSARFEGEVRIGLFLPEEKNDHLSRALCNAAYLAVKEFNTAGGYNGQPYRIIRRWADDSWKAGSREVIRLVYEDSVVALIGSTDGNTTHIAEQIATKAWIPLLSPVSADPTLTHIRIPWMFRLTPDFASQSKILIEDGLKQLASKRVGIICCADHDGRVFSKEIQKALAMEDIVPVFQFNFASTLPDYQQIASRSGSFDVDALIVYMKPEQIVNFLRVWEQSQSGVVFCLPWTPGLTRHVLNDLFTSKIYMIKPFQTENNKPYQLFLTRYKREFGELPLPAAAYMYDTLNLLRLVIEKNGLDRLKIRDAIAQYSILNGVTGKISWDNTGGNISNPLLEKIGP